MIFDPTRLPKTTDGEHVYIGDLIYFVSSLTKHSQNPSFTHMQFDVFEFLITGIEYQKSRTMTVIKCRRTRDRVVRHLMVRDDGAHMEFFKDKNLAIDAHKDFIK